MTHANCAVPHAKYAVPHAKYAVSNKVIPKLSPELSPKRCYQLQNVQYPPAKHAVPTVKYAVPNAKHAVPTAKYAVPHAKYAVQNKVIPKLSTELSPMDLSKKNRLEK